MMRSWTVPLSSWRWASAACGMGMVWWARSRSLPPASRAIVWSRAAGAWPGSAWDSVTPKSAAAGSDKVMTRFGPPARAVASARTPVPAASTTALLTVIPRATASWVAMMPTGPPPPNSSSLSPLRTFSCRSTRAASSAELGSAAASGHDTDCGLAVQVEATAYSAYPPRLSSRAVTGSPAAVPVTPGPAASTVPAASKPSTASGGSGQALRYPARSARSVGLIPAALTLILICPGPGSGSRTAAHVSTSGGPYPVITTALGIAVPSLSGRGLGMAADGHVSVVVTHCVLLARSRRAAPAGPYRPEYGRAVVRSAGTVMTAGAGPALMAAPARPSRISAPHGGEDGGDDQHAAGAFGVVDDPAGRRSGGQGTLQRGDEQGQASLDAGRHRPRHPALRGHRHRPVAQAPDSHHRDNQRARAGDRREQQGATGDQKARAHQRGPQVSAYGDAGGEVGGRAGEAKPEQHQRDRAGTQAGPGVQQRPDVGVGGKVGEEDRTRGDQADPRDRQRDHRQQRPGPDPAAGAQPRHRGQLGRHRHHREDSRDRERGPPRGQRADQRPRRQAGHRREEDPRADHRHRGAPGPLADQGDRGAGPEHPEPAHAYTKHGAGCEHHPDVRREAGDHVGDQDQRAQGDQQPAPLQPGRAKDRKS